MTAEQAYKAVLSELRKENTSSMTPEEFNQHSWFGMLEYVKTRYWVYEQHQKSIDDLSPLIVVTDGMPGNPAPIPNTGNAVPGQEVFGLPYTENGTGYLYLLSAEANVTYKGHPCFPDGRTATVPMNYKQLNQNSANIYDKETEDYIWYYIAENQIRTRPGFPGIAQSCVASYLKYPVRMQINLLTGASIINPDLGEMAMLEVVKWTAASFLETIESLRQQTMLALQGQVFNNQTNP